ncbi:competence protein CoiA family protein [Sabulicella rubraurantiaca]|uniref:competence protein CoiA family protein n=1 Tax=Sabulicella rubraurantiaca TaxID=2811429 RepID=UPI001A962FE9|nr:hypothetical protein [Sabulicella rubraurantiaca]
MADVLVAHEGVRRVIEIQLSPQSAAETRRRSARYDQAGLQVLWLFRSLPEGLALGPDQPAAVVLPTGEADAEAAVRRRAAAFAVGQLVWSDGTGAAPFTLVGYDAQCQRCGELYHRTPYALVRLGEVNGRWDTRIIPTKRLNPVGRGPWRQPSSCQGAPEARDDPLGRRLGGGDGLRCPHCRTDAPRDAPLLPQEEAWLWPHAQVDGWTRWAGGRPGWRPAPAPSRPYRPVGDEPRWRAALERCGLLLDRQAAALTFPGLRQAYEAKAELAPEAIEFRRLSDNLEAAGRQRRVFALVQELEGARGSCVAAEVAYDRAEIRRIRLRFPFDRQGAEALKAMGARWIPTERAWVVAVGRRKQELAERVREAVHELRARLDGPLG